MKAIQNLNLRFSKVSAPSTINTVEDIESGLSELCDLQVIAIDNHINTDAIDRMISHYEDRAFEISSQ